MTSQRQGRAPSRLELRGVSKNFGGVHAVEDVHLRIDSGEVVALLGDNAAGKSTVARIIGGVLQPDAGSLTMDGERVVIDSPRAASRLGIASVFQEQQLVESLDVVENLFLGQELRARTGLLDSHTMREQAREHLGRLSARVPDLQVPLQSLSAGQRQCVAIARTLVNDPSVVVLDEPTASLSVSQTAVVLDYIDNLRERGLGVLLISHNLADVRAVADRVEVLRHGRNNGSFSASLTSYEELIAAITGAAQF